MYTVASAPDLTGSVFMRKIQIILGQCEDEEDSKTVRQGSISESHRPYSRLLSPFIDSADIHSLHLTQFYGYSYR